METFIDESSPLAGLLEGEGLNSTSSPPSETAHTPPLRQSNFAPLPSSLRSRLGSSALSNLRLRIPHRRKISESISRHAWSGSMTVEAQGFLDRFRYVLVASQMLEESPDHGLLAGAKDVGQTQGSGVRLFTYKGAGLTAGLAGVGVWLTAIANKGVAAVVVGVVYCALLAVVVWVYGRRQSVKYIRVKALEGAAELVQSLQGYELASGSALGLVQEVEVVVKGHVFQTPPHSRSEDIGSLKRCLPLRRCLARTLFRLIEVLDSARTKLIPLVDSDDFNKFLDIYDVPREALEQAASTTDGSDVESETLGALRILSFRVGVLRRAVLCILLALESTGDMADHARWRQATVTMQNISNVANTNSQRLMESLAKLEELDMPLSPVSSPRQANQKLRTQVRKISNLSSGIKSLQAKMTLLREQSNAAVSRADALSDLGPLLMAQYESIGPDIQALLREWENGKLALTANITKHERRISLNSSSSPIMRSPGLSSTFSGLASLDESGLDEILDERSDTRRPPSTSPRSSMPPTPSDEEVFEAVSLPKRRVSLSRANLSREERIRVMHEERARAEERKARRESGLNMIRELKTVINLKKNPSVM